MARVNRKYSQIAPEPEDRLAWADRPLSDAIHHRLDEKLSAKDVLKNYLTAATSASGLEGTKTRADAMDLLLVCWDSTGRDPQTTLSLFETRIGAPSTVKQYKVNRDLLVAKKAKKPRVTNKSPIPSFAAFEAI